MYSSSINETSPDMENILETPTVMRFIIEIWPCGKKHEYETGYKTVLDILDSLMLSIYINHPPILTITIKSILYYIPQIHQS